MGHHLNISIPFFFPSLFDFLISLLNPTQREHYKDYEADYAELP
jgi:hypothetical protein